MLVALSVRFILSYLSVIITRGRTSTLELKLLTNTDIHSHFPFISVIHHSVAPVLLNELEKQLGYGAWLLSWLFPTSTFLQIIQA